MINTIPEEFNDLMDNYDPDDYLFSITAVYSENGKTICNIKIHNLSVDESIDNIHPRWSINVAGYKECQLNFRSDSMIEILTEHPLLWKYNDVNSSLYFHGTCTDPYALLIELYHINEQLFEGHHNFTEIKKLHHLLQQPGGLLANGPGQLLEKYAQLLEKYALTPSIIGRHIPQHWNGTKYEQPSRQTKMCWIGKNFIIAESFEFIKINS